MTLHIRTGTRNDLSTLVAIDDDAADLYASAGIIFDVTAIAPFVEAEQSRWERALSLGRVFLAHRDGEPVGFAAMDLLDGSVPYLEQLSVRMSAMRQGIGSALVRGAIAWAAGNPRGLWLTTYGHLEWNRPFYERHGFALVPEGEWGAELRQHVDAERRYLPAPQQRVVMRR